MKKIFIFIPCLLLVVLMSCDNRTSKRDRLQQAVSEFNKNQRLIDVSIYYPESYTETKTDSIISSTFDVSIKNYALTDQNILLNQSVKHLKKTSKYHRVFESDILVTVADKIVFERHISAEHFKSHSTSEFWNSATLEHVWVNQENSNSEKLSLSLSFINPKRNTFKLYELHIDINGNERLTLIEDHS